MVSKLKFKNKYEELFFKALLIRMVEEKIVELYPEDKIQSPVHLSIGQEAVAVCLCNNLDADSTIFINYRGHAFYLAKGGDLSKFFAELYGKAGGVSKGKAGSMHLSSKDHGIMGASAVVGSTISHGVGFALADKINNRKRLTVTIFGDGATEQGVFHESLNFASLYNVPIIFLCENNGLAVHASLKERQSYKIKNFSKNYNIDYFGIAESFDLVETYNEFKKIINNFKLNPRPIFIEIATYRYKEHVGPGKDFDAGYRSIDDYNLWLKKDPIEKDIKLREEFKEKILFEINNAIEFAEKSPIPSYDELLKDVL